MTSIKLGTQSIASIHRKFTKVLVSSCWQWWIQMDLQVRRSQVGGGGVGLKNYVYQPVRLQCGEGLIPPIGERLVPRSAYHLTEKA